MSADPPLTEARAALRDANRIAVLTGAGISAASGIPTFRDAPGALWAQYRPEDLASPLAYARDPALVWEWYAWRYRACASAEPNAAHRLLAALELVRGDALTLVTQNVDGLHQRAWSARVVELHGHIPRARCERCARRAALPPAEAFTPPPTCDACGSRMRPDVVWFGESLPRDALDRAWDAFTAADVALVVGTSAVVEPAASLGRVARSAGAYLVEVNPQSTPLTPRAHASLRANAVAGLEALLAPETAEREGADA